jgi:hypothetical protein
MNGKPGKGRLHYKRPAFREGRSGSGQEEHCLLTNGRSAGYSIIIIISTFTPMKKISVRNIFTQAYTTFLRFPLTILLSVALSCLSIYVFEARWSMVEYEWPLQAQKAIYLGMLLSISVMLFAESTANSRMAKIAGGLVCLVFMCVYYYSLSGEGSTPGTYRFILLSVSLHVLVPIAGFLRYRRFAGLWLFSKAIFLRILLAFLYSVVLYIGIALALVAIDNLLGVRLPSNIYLHLWIVILGIFNTWFFLAGVPQPGTIADDAGNYPRGLRIFTANVLLPLVVIYAVILYLYAIRLLTEPARPHTGLATMVGAFGFFGILSLLLLYPIIVTGESKWLRGFSRAFYIVMIPLALLLFFDLQDDIAAKGIREMSYLVILLAAWLIFVSVYSLLKPSASIRMVPVSLFLVTFLCAFGPWGVLGISERSQFSRLRQLLSERNMLVNGKVPDTVRPIHQNYDAQLDEQVSYMVWHFGYSSLQPAFETDLAVLMDSPQLGFTGDREIMRFMYGDMPGAIQPVTPAGDQSQDQEPEYVQYANADQRQMFDCDGYRYSADFNFAREGHGETRFVMGKDSLTVRYEPALSKFTVWSNGRKAPEMIDITASLDTLFAMADEPIPRSALSFSGRGKGLQVLVCINNLELIKTRTLRAGSVNGKIFVAK